MPGFVLQAAPAPAEIDRPAVLVGRQAALKRDFAVLSQDLVEALKRLKALATP